MKTNRALVVIVIFLVIWNSFLTAQYFTGDKSTASENITNVEVSGFSTDFSELADVVKGSAVAVSSSGTISSGVIYGSYDSGIYIVTAAHGITDKSNISVILDNDVRIAGIFAGEDIYSDIALIKADCSFAVPALKLGDSEMLKDGEYLLVAGTPGSLEFRNSLTVAMVSDSLRTVSNSITADGASYSYYLSLIQLSSDVTEGYSGSPLFNMAGECVGIVTMKSHSEVMAVPVNEVKLIVEKLIAGNEIDKAMFGIKGEYIAGLETYVKSNMGINIERTDGIYVSAIYPGFLASLMGLKAGDVIDTINETKIATNTDFLHICYSGAKEYVFSVVRGEETIELKGMIDD